MKMWIDLSVSSLNNKVCDELAHIQQALVRRVEIVLDFGIS